jgi:hypothetical protein
MSQADATSTSRRTLLTSAVAAAALTGAVGANVAAIALTAERDPILTAIDQYWTAVRRRRVTEKEIWDYAAGNGAHGHLPKDHPYWGEKEEIFDEAFNGEWEALDALFETTPTTVAGVAALLLVLGTDPYHDPNSGRKKGESVLEWAQGDRERVNQLMSTLASALRTAGGVRS